VIADEIRSAYLKFFEEKGHAVIPSSSLIPHGDPTLLLTSAGMVQFKPYYLGEAVPPNPRLVSCQKCFRTTDIESVGDPSHLTFFEMLGNFSIGDYFKKESIAWAWEFVTERLKLAKDKLWVTIYLDDDESFNYWRAIDVPAERILRFGEKENFWGPAGNSGPCGPCSEIHFDFGENIGCGKPDCKPNSGCTRFSEIWNLVFTQYNQDETGKRIPLPKPNIDTGMGLERTTAAVIGKTSVYDTPLFTPLLATISRLSGKKYGAGGEIDNAMRVVAEHGRGIPFLIADGVLPSNEGRGYVLRRLLRRAVAFGRTLGLDKPFLTETAKATMELMGHVYPEIVQRRDFILRVVELEEARFGSTLSSGLNLLEEMMEEAAEVSKKGVKEISGETAFKLYDTFGFPVELTREIAQRRGFTVDLDGFKQEMEKQRKRARKADLFAKEAEAKEAAVARSYESTPFVGYRELKHNSVIIDIMVDGKVVESIARGQKASVVLETTPFYGEMGGQVGDTGEIRCPEGRFIVTDTIRIPPDITVHRGQVAEGKLETGAPIEAAVDRQCRLDIARNHTATHLLHYALRTILGKHVEQRGSLVAPESFRFDFSHLTSLTPEELQKVQALVNEKIRENLPVRDEEMPYRRAVEEGAIAIFEEKYGDTVRVLKTGDPPISMELCGGTHVSATGEIGFFKITSEGSIGSGLRRIEAVTGRGAEKFVNDRLTSLEKMSQSLGATLENVEEKLTALVEEMDKGKKRALGMERELARIRAEALLKQVEVIKGVNVLIARVPAARLEILREMADFLRDKLKSIVLVLGSVDEERPVFLAAVTPDLIAKGYDAGKIVREVAKVTGGGGGGRPNLAQAGGKDKSKLDEALRVAKGLL
jgi:alanyl-tRNA synthetase